MSPVKSGSAKTCALIVNVQGAARSTGKNVSRIERGPAPSRARGDGGDREGAERERGDDDGEQPVASERVRAVGDELGAPLLVGPRLARAPSTVSSSTLGRPCSAISRPATSVSHESATRSVGGKTVRKTMPNAA